MWPPQHRCHTADAKPNGDSYPYCDANSHAYPYADGERRGNRDGVGIVRGVTTIPARLAAVSGVASRNGLHGGERCLGRIVY